MIFRTQSLSVLMVGSELIKASVGFIMHATRILYQAFTISLDFFPQAMMLSK